MKVLVINPGSTSTKIAVYEDRTALFSENIIHPGDELAACGPELTDQLPLRERVVREALAKHGIAPVTINSTPQRRAFRSTSPDFLPSRQFLYKNAENTAPFRA